MIQITSDFKSYKLDSPNKNRCDFWDEIMNELDNSWFPLLVLQANLEFGVGGYYSDEFSLDEIALGNKVHLNETERLISFEDDWEFAIFVHEASHFRHLGRDEGLLVSTGLKEFLTMEMVTSDKKFRRQAEFEAGMRSMIYAKEGGLFDNMRIPLELNLHNMLYYDYKNLTEEGKKIYEKACELKFQEQFDMLKDAFYRHVKTFEEWEDPAHKIKM